VLSDLFEVDGLSYEEIPTPKEGDSRESRKTGEEAFS